MASRSAGLVVVDRLKLELHERVAETLRSVCSTFQQELELAAQPPAPSASSQVDYDTYNDCCQRLVQYIAANMDTSPYFTQQMDRIILACHSNTSQEVLGSLVTKDVWLRPREEETVAVNERAQDEALDAVAEAKETAVKTENVQVDAVSSFGDLPVRAEAKTDPSRRRRSRTLARKSVAPGREIQSTSASNAAMGYSGSKRSMETSTLPVKRRRQEEDQTVIELFSSAEEDERGESGVEVNAFAGLFSTDADTETEDGSSNDVELDAGNDDDNDDEEDEEWIEDENDDNEESNDDEGDDDVEKGGAIRRPIVDVVGVLCHPERRSARQTKVFKDRLSNGIQVLDALLCKPSPEKVCLRNCQKLRRQWCQNIGTCRNEPCQLWHEVDAHVLCCRNKQCEYSIQVMLRETMHQIEHQHERIRKVRRELNTRRKELGEAESQSSTPTSNALLLKKQVALLERELSSEEDQLEFYLCVKRVNTDAAKEVEIDTIEQFAEFQKHYAARVFPQNSMLPKEEELPADGSHTKKDDLLPPVDDAIGNLCYAGQRSQADTQMFKECLRKSIEFIDALLCKPPSGKACMRNCKRIRANRCTKDVPCDDAMCRNWHNAEAHTDNCYNPQCEFKLRIVLREIMHSIEEKQRTVHEERARIRKKKSALETIKNDAENLKRNHCYRPNDPRRHDTFLESEILQDEIDQLSEDLQKEERVLSDMNTKKKDLQEKLYIIGIDESGDVADGFPVFTTHYETKGRSRK